MRSRPRSAGGFSLVEVLAALVVFSITTLALVPVILVSLRGTNVARSFTIGKNGVSQAIERARGLPYFIAYGAEASRVDVLDLYFPDAANTDEDPAAEVYETLCTPATVGVPACPPDLPDALGDSYELRFSAAFVEPSTTPGDDTFTPVTPPGTYAWDSPGNDSPPTQLLALTTEASWEVAGIQRDFSSRTLIGDREFGNLSLRATANISFAVQAIIPFRNSELVAVAGTSTSKVESRRNAVADHSTVASRLRLIDTSTGGGADLVSPPDGVQGAVSDWSAPDPASPSGDWTPISSPSTNADAPLTSLSFGTLGQMALADATSVRDVYAAVGDGTPMARGTFSLSPTGEARDFWVHNPEATLTALRLAVPPAGQRSDNPLMYVTPIGTANTGSTRAETDPTTAPASVLAQASVALGEISLLPMDFRPGVPEGPVVRITGFQAGVDCSSTSAGGGTATGSYRATLQYWADLNDNGDVTDGAYQSIALDSAAGLVGPTTMRGLKANPPLVYDGARARDDIYLFPRSANDASYLADWQAVVNPVARTQAAGGGSSNPAMQASASLNGAIRIETGVGTGMSVSLGAMNCRSEDRR